MACDQSNEIERPADNVIRVPFLEDSGTACVDVQPGDTIILPFDVSNISPDMAVRARLLGSDVVIEQPDGATIFLEGFAQAVGDSDAVIVQAVGGKPIDMALWVATTDPALVISH